jgi:hypothetical protein
MLSDGVKAILLRVRIGAQFSEVFRGGRIGVRRSKRRSRGIVAPCTTIILE